MRLNRYILVRWCQDNNIEIAYDEISNDDKTYYDYQILKVWRDPFITEFKNKSFKYFDNTKRISVKCLEFHSTSFIISTLFRIFFCKSSNFISHIQNAFR